MLARGRRLPEPGGERGGDGEHRAGGDQEGHPHAEHPAQHQEHDGPDAHLEGDRPGGQRAVPGRDEIGHERLEGRSLHVYPRMQENDRADQGRKAERSR